MSDSINEEDKDNPIIEDDVSTTKEEVENTPDLQSEVENLKELLMRSYAETENLRKRYEKQISDLAVYSIAGFAKDLMSVMDNLDRTLEYKPEELNKETEALIQGVDLTKKELNKVFLKHHLEKLEPKLGDSFDYNLHHAIKNEETDQYKTGQIISVMQVGYKIKERLLRPCLVAVAK